MTYVSVESTLKGWLREDRLTPRLHEVGLTIGAE